MLLLVGLKLAADLAGLAVVYTAYGVAFELGLVNAGLRLVEEVRALGVHEAHSRSGAAVVQPRPKLARDLVIGDAARYELREVVVEVARQLLAVCPDARREVFTGKLPRFENLQVILDLMENVSPLHFERKGNTIFIQ